MNHYTVCVSVLFSILTPIDIYCVNIKSIFEGKRSEFDPEIFFDSAQILQKFNYTSELHTVYTEDGYLLTLYRIPRNGYPMLLTHGIGDSSDEWLVMGPNRSLAFLLADHGYDVWLFNTRGNRYSNKHSKKIFKEEYWNFSYEEIGTYDLPATIDYILSETNRSKLTYVGFSQGCTAFLVLCSIKTEYNNKINHAIFLAPVAWLKNTKHPFIGILAENLNELTTYLRRNEIYEYSAASEKNILYHASICNVNSPLNILCGIEIYVLLGLMRLTNLIPERLPIIITHTTAGFSIKTLLHYLQSSVTKRFSRFDYGKRKNQLIYSSPTPPDYNISLVSVPVTIFVSEVDWFASPEDVAILKNEIGSEVKIVTLEKDLQFTHLEFVYGTRANSLINQPVLEMLRTL